MTGLTLEPDGAGRWLIREPGRPGAAGVLGEVTPGDRAGRFVLALRDAEAGPPAGPYGSPQEALDAVEVWRSARFDGFR